MLSASVLSGRAKYLVLALPLFFIFTYIATQYYSSPLVGSARQPAGRPPGATGGRTGDRTGDRAGSYDPTDWWVEFFTRLQDTRVAAPPLKIEGRARGDNWRPDIDYARPELLELNEADKAKFRDSHAAFVKQLPEFADHLPFRANTTGIVTTAGPPNFGQAVSLVLMTRQTGSRLPIEIVLDSSAPWVDAMCADAMPRYDATCIYLEEKWAKLVPFTARFERFQWKLVSIVASSFQNVLFLDADCLPVQNPDPIFAPGAEPFASAGFITWPDFWTPSSSPLFYKVAGDLEVPPLTARTTSESGVMVYDKARHADTLLLAAYYNYNGPDRYYTMLTQHGPGEGDKETFLQAALVLEGLRDKGVYDDPTGWMRLGVGVKKGYWDVKKLPVVHGRTAKGKQWRGMFMQQMDPMEDYRVIMAAVDKAKAADAAGEGITSGDSGHGKPTRAIRGSSGNGGSTITATSSSSSSTRRDQQPPPPPPPRRVNPAEYITNSTFLAHVGNLTLDPPHDPARFMFFHHNGVKPDLTRVLDPKAGIAAVDDADRPLRMWGDPGWIVQRTGRDVEKILWRESMDLYCPGLREQGGQKQQGEEKQQQPQKRNPGRGEVDWDKVCAEIKRIWDAVFA